MDNLCHLLQTLHSQPPYSYLLQFLQILNREASMKNLSSLQLHFFLFEFEHSRDQKHFHFQVNLGPIQTYLLKLNFLKPDQSLKFFCQKLESTLRQQNIC